MRMIDDVDRSLKALVTRDVLNGSGAEVTFEAPTKEWAARRTTPTLDLYLYDIQEDVDRRDNAYEDVRDDQGMVTDRRPPPRRFALSYLVTAWTQRPEDEHRLLSATLSCFLRFDRLPDAALQGSLEDIRWPVLVTVALPPPKDRSISDLWTALGGELKASLDLVLIVPFDTARVIVAAPPVVEEPRIDVVTEGRADETSPGPRRRGQRRKGPSQTGLDVAVIDETKQSGTETKPGRTLRVRETRSR
jgi:hypothetical protein